MDLLVGLPEHLGQQLKSLRKLRGMSQGELGARLGVTQSRVAQIEAQPGSVSLDQILRMLQVFGAELLIRTAGSEDAARYAAPTMPAPPTQGGTPADAPVLFREPRKGTW